MNMYLVSELCLCSVPLSLDMCVHACVWVWVCTCMCVWTTEADIRGLPQSLLILVFEMRVLTVTEAQKRG